MLFLTNSGTMAAHVIMYYTEIYDNVSSLNIKHGVIIILKQQ